MPTMFLSYQEGDPRFQEIRHPRSEHGPSIFIYDTSTGTLYKRRHVCPTNPTVRIVDPIEDDGLRRIVLGNDESSGVDNSYLANRFLSRQ